jgi:hypothetical protein
MRPSIPTLELMSTDDKQLAAFFLTLKRQQRIGFVLYCLLLAVRSS